MSNPIKHLDLKHSSNMHWSRYDPETQTLEIDFKNSKGQKVSTYKYENFSHEEWDRFQASDSKGKHFAYHIRPKFTGVKL